MLEKLPALALDRRTPLLVSTLYLLCIACMNKRLRRIKGPFHQRERLSKATFFMVSYNAFMCFSSLALFRSLFSVLENFYRNFGLACLLRDPSSALRRQTKFHVQAFHATKYLEIVDSIVVHIRRKKASFMHVYAHTGAIICSWLLCISDSHLSCIFVSFNTFVHIFIYAYYAVLSLRVSLPVRKIITYMQIAQLVLGSAALLSILAFAKALSGDPGVRRRQHSIAAFLLFYALSLLLLFRSLVKKKYSSKRGKAE